MPVSYQIDSVQKVVYTIFEGAVTDQEFVQHATEIKSDPEIDGSFVELIDGHTSSMEGVLSSGILGVANALRVSSAIRKIAIVASRDVEFGIARMVQSLAHDSPIEIKAFRERADARSWLGLE